MRELSPSSVEICRDTAEWYKNYEELKGPHRNDLLVNPGVLFQVLAQERSLIECLRVLPVDCRDWRVLDVGCGTGGSLARLLGLGFSPDRLYGVDIDADRVAEARRRLQGCHFAHSDGTRLGFASAQFDLVMESTMFIQVIDDGVAHMIASEMLRVLKPSGYVLLIDWRYGGGRPEYSPLSKKRVSALFGVGQQTTVRKRSRGALVPPVGRFLSQYVPSAYFIVQAFLPAVVGQMTTVLQKTQVR